MVERVESLAPAPMGDELAMLDLDTGKYFVIDRLGAVIWERLEATVRVADLLAELKVAYDVTPQRCEADVIAFLRQLHDKGLVRAWKA